MIAGEPRAGVDNGVDAQRRAWIATAEAHVSEDGLADLVASMVGIASPTGDEAPLAGWLASRLRAGGLDGWIQSIDERQANAVGRLAGSGGGASLLLYAPIDTLTADDPDEDCPVVGDVLERHMHAAARRDERWVTGLGASNPKGHAACAAAAALAIAAAGIPLRGDLLVGLGAGGMPTNARGEASRRNTGQGVGCSFLLEQGVFPDAAVIAKPGWSVAHEEVGLCWFSVVVHGAHGYVGARHRIPYDNPILSAGLIAADLEQWFAEYAARNTSGLVAPQASIGTIAAGWPRSPSFIPASCRITMDVRTSPRTPPGEVRHQFEQAVDEIRERHPGVRVDWEMELSIIGTSTPADHWIVRSVVDAWQDVDGGAHVAVAGTSGATDANILRSRGVPTARVGMPKARDHDGTEVGFALGMNAAVLADMVQLTRVLIRVAVATCTPPRHEVIDHVPAGDGSNRNDLKENDVKPSDG